MKNNTQQLGQAISDSIKVMEEARTSKGITGVPSGFTQLDRITSGWQGSDLIIIAARPSMGKTALALTFAANAAIRNDFPVAIFSLEMSNLQLAQRLMASETELGMEKLRKGHLDDREFEQLTTMIAELAEAPIIIDDTPGLTLVKFEEKARMLVAEEKVQLIVLDYVQLMKPDPQIRPNREQEISIISRALKSLAKELNIPIIALSQLNRSVEQRGGSKRPHLSDLRDSGALEEDADMVLFVYRQDYYGMQGEGGMDDLPPDTAEIIIAKNRNGALDNVHLRFKKEFAKFEEYEPSAVDFQSFREDSFDMPQSNLGPMPSKNWDNDSMNDIEEGPF